jgi:tetratricopeptide (TPR) repeat protein
MHDLAALLDLGDAARDGRPDSRAAFRHAVEMVDDLTMLLDAASQFPDDETIAVIFLRRCVALDRRSIEAWQELAALYTRFDPAARRWKTRAAIRRALGLAPSNLFVMRIRLSVLEQRGAMAKAIRYAPSIMRIDPNFFEPVRILARVLAKDGRIDTAILELRRFKERISVTDARMAAWLIAQAEEAEGALVLIGSNRQLVG